MKCTTCSVLSASCFNAHWCGFRSCHSFQRWAKTQRKRGRVMSFLRRSTGGAPPVTSGDTASMDWCRDRWPALFEHLTATRWDNGEERQTSSLSVFMDSGVLKACLNDKAESRVAFVASASFEGLLDALDEGIQNGSLDWRRSPQGRGRSR